MILRAYVFGIFATQACITLTTFARRRNQKPTWSAAMTEWILIVIVGVGLGGTNPRQIAMERFKSQESCTEAINKIRSMLASDPDRGTFLAECVKA